MKYFIFAAIILITNCVQAQRVYDNPQDLLPKAKAISNNKGGHDYYINGKRVARTETNIHGSLNFYHMNKLKYRGIYFKNTDSTSFYGAPNKSHSTKPTGKFFTPEVNKMEKRDSELKRWSMSREKNTNSIKWWDFWYNNP